MLYWLLTSGNAYGTERQRPVMKLMCTHVNGAVVGCNCISMHWNQRPVFDLGADQGERQCQQTRGRVVAPVVPLVADASDIDHLASRALGEIA